MKKQIRHRCGKKQSWDVKGSVCIYNSHADFIQLALFALHDDLFVKPKALSPKLVYIEDQILVNTMCDTILYSLSRSLQPHIIPFLGRISIGAWDSKSYDMRAREFQHWCVCDLAKLQLLCHVRGAKHPNIVLKYCGMTSSS